jgi:hypothetical protein
VTGTLPVANGGTGNTFFSVSGPASSTKTYTFPNENMTVGKPPSGWHADWQLYAWCERCRQVRASRHGRQYHDPDIDFC